MAYTTQAQVEHAAGGATRLLQICATSLGALDTDRLEAAQRYADVLINGHCRMRFAALLDEDDETVDTAIALAADETVYRLRRQLNQNSKIDDDDAAARMAIYEKIADGTFVPSDPAPAASDNVRSERVAFGPSARSKYDGFA